ncbi:MAG: hypothetical protein QOE66_2693 [Chloroflexota bacterium]|jgi:hypothetical protein|nr:hypothetical protein [Chloroflexota bacterium]
MEEPEVRERAEALCAALVAGDIEQATRDFSKELRQNLGEVLVLLPLPSTEATIESVDRGGGSGFTIVLRLVGETEEVLIQTRWKERDGQPTLIEVSHLSKIETTAPTGEAADDGDASREEERS